MDANRNHLLTPVDLIANRCGFLPAVYLSALFFRVPMRSVSSLLSKLGNHAPLRSAIAAAFFIFATAFPAKAEIQHVIAISVDGLRGDFLKTFVDTAPADFPNFARLRNAGASTFNARCDYNFSETVPNHISMITGRPVSQPTTFGNQWHHGFTSNFPTLTETIHTSGNPAVAYKHSIFDVVHDHGRSTGLYVSKSRLAILERSFNATNGALDTIGPDNGRDKVDVYFENSSTSLISSLVPRISSTLENFTFIHITEPDSAGHSFGWTTTVGGSYWNSVKTVDGFLGSILNALDGNSALTGRFAILLTADHGGGGGTGGITGHTDATKQENYTIPFFIVAPGIAGGIDLNTVLLNRFDSGPVQPDYWLKGQPVRNSDIANLSAALLGLPNVPGSFFEPEFNKPVKTAISGNTITVTWPRYLTGWTLEATGNLVNDPWTTITTGITEGVDSFTHTSAVNPDQKFYRLRRPANP